MKEMNTLKEQSTEALQQQLLDYNKELFALRMQRANNQEGLKTHRFKAARRAIAQIKTVLSQRGAEENSHDG